MPVVRESRLKVSEDHELQIYEVGNRGRTPVIFLHGGPGTGINELHKNLFDPSRYHAILFDQRGCGRSTPRLALQGNTTWNLAEDIETIRKHFGYDSWYVVGGSWGSTLSLAYATRFPEVVRGMVIWATTQFQPNEILEMCRVFPLFYPDRWDEYIKKGGTAQFEKIPEFEYKEMTQGSAQRKALSLERSRSLWSAGLTLDDSFQIQGDSAETTMLFFFHYCVNSGFFDTDTLPSNLGSRLAEKPVRVLHGRQDMRCFAQTSYQIHQAIPGSKLQIITVASHGAADGNMRKAIQEALSEISD